MAKKVLHNKFLYTICLNLIEIRMLKIKNKNSRPDFLRNGIKRLKSNRSGQLEKETVSLILAAIGLIFLIVVGWFIYSGLTGMKYKEQAKATLNLISKMMQDAELSASNESYDSIYLPIGWWIVSFPTQGLEESQEWKIKLFKSSPSSIKRPTKCTGNCICVCESPQSCASDSICTLTYGGKSTGELFDNTNLRRSVLKQIDKQFVLGIESNKEKNYFRFNYDFNFNADKLAEDGEIELTWFERVWMVGTESLSCDPLLLGINRALKDSSQLMQIPADKSSDSDAWYDNGKIIEHAAKSGGVNPAIVLAILKSKYELFNANYILGATISDTSMDAKTRVSTAIGNAAIKEYAFARARGIECEVYKDEPLKSLVACISKILKVSRDDKKAELYFGGVIPSKQASRVIDGLTVTPQTEDTAVLWYYSQNSRDVVKIYKEYDYYKKEFDKAVKDSKMGGVATGETPCFHIL